MGLKMVLERTGRFAVMEAENGINAIAAVEKMAPNVVVMDIQMPVMDGITATQIIHERWPQNPRPPHHGKASRIRPHPGGRPGHAGRTGLRGSCYLFVWGFVLTYH